MYFESILEEVFLVLSAKVYQSKRNLTKSAKFCHGKPKLYLPCYGKRSQVYVRDATNIPLERAILLKNHLTVAS